jgi:hypothetical protein
MVSAKGRCPESELSFMWYALYGCYLLLVMGSTWVLFPDLLPRELNGNDLMTLLLGGLFLVWVHHHLK